MSELYQERRGFARDVQCAEEGLVCEDNIVRTTQTPTAIGFFAMSTDNATTNSSLESSGPADHALSDCSPHYFECYPQGFPRIAAFQNSTSDLAIFRRFGTAHCRVLMHLQCEITNIIQELDKLDLADADENSGMLYRLRRNEWYDGWDRTQKDLLDKLQAKLVVYDDILLKDRSLRAVTPPRSRHYQSLFNWIIGNKPLDEGQYDFLFDQNDFIGSSTHSNTNRFEDIIEKCLNRWPETVCFWKSLVKRAKPDRTENSNVYTFSRSKAILTAKILSVSVAGVMLLLPIFVLYLSSMSDKAMAAVVLVFVLLFGLLMSLFTGAQVESVFIGTCTYCAVLVTFLGSVQLKDGAGGH